jgi:hypothetical protein
MSNLLSSCYRRFNHWFVAKSRPARKHAAGARSRRTCLNLEELENRLVPAVYKVTTLSDISIAAGVDPATGKIKDQKNTVTLRSAIEASNATPGSNTIELVLPGVYKIGLPGSGEDNNQTGDFDIIPNAGSAPNSSLTIISPSGNKAIVDGNNLDRVFDINPSDASTPTGFTVILKGFTIQNGSVSPGDGAAGSGGGIRDQGNVNLTLNNMVVTRNSATADGGGLVMLNSVDGTWTLTITNSIISNDHAGDAGGGIDTDGAGTVNISGSVISGNTDINQGAGVYIDLAVGASPGAAGANMTMTKTIVSNNDALAGSTTVGQGGSGGGISNAGTGLMTIISSTIASNFAGGSGGGFDDENGFGSLDVQKSLFVNNSAVLGGGAIHEGGPSATITGSEIKDNSSGAAGGGIFANGATLTLQASTIAYNTSATNGGGLELQTTGKAANGSTITDVTLVGNSALFNGGANGGGIDAPAGFTGAVSLVNDTINANFADNGGGVFWSGATGSSFAVFNTIIAANLASTAGPDANNPAGTFTDNGGNLIGVTGTGSGNTGFTVSTHTGTVASPLDPLLGVLGNNGGPKVGAPGDSITLETEAPLAGSPAIGNGIDNASTPADDERGFPSVTKKGHTNLVNIGAVSQAKHK